MRKKASVGRASEQRDSVLGHAILKQFQDGKQNQRRLKTVTAEAMTSTFRRLRLNLARYTLKIEGVKKMNIVSLIPIGYENAITRAELRTLTGLPDRKVRDMIFQARRETPILNLQDGKGYFKPTEDERELVERYLKQEESRFKTIAWTLHSAREFLKE
jgi:hypothetical protein